MATGGSGFLGRWSRRKAETRSKAPEPPVAAEAVPTETDAAPAEDTPAPLELPDIESLGKDSDYTMFLQDGVPDEIRNLALRKLWLSDPEFNVCDGLDDYDEDYNIIETIANKIAEVKDEAGKDKDGGGDGAADHKPEADETPPPQDSDPPAPEAPSSQIASTDDVPGTDDESDETPVPT